ncbi:hypothetical protein ACFX2J_022675 [Malus domestica]
MTVLGETRTFQILEAMRYPSDIHECNYIYLSLTLQALVETQGWDDSLERALTLIESEEDAYNEARTEILAALEAMPFNMPSRWPCFKPLPSSTEKPIPSVIQVPRLELKPIPDHLKYAYLGNENTLPVIINAHLSDVETEKLVRVLRENKKAIGWTIVDIKGISPTKCMHQILLEDGAKPTKEAQRRLNPPIKEVVKKEILKLLDVGIIYSIFDSKWVSLIHVVPKTSDITIFKNENDDKVPTRVQTSWRVCTDYRTLNATIRKDHFPLPSIDQMLVGHNHYCFLDSYSRYNQIAIAHEDQEMTTFTCPFGTFAYRRMPFGLCNAPSTF